MELVKMVAITVEQVLADRKVMRRMIEEGLEAGADTWRGRMHSKLELAEALGIDKEVKRALDAILQAEKETKR